MSSAIPCGADVRGRRPRRQGIVTAPSDCHFPWTCVRALGVATWSKVGLEIWAKCRPPENPVNSVGKCNERESNGGGLEREMRLAVAFGGPAGGLHTIRTLRRAGARRRDGRSVRAVTGRTRLQAPVIRWAGLVGCFLPDHATVAVHEGSRWGKYRGVSAARTFVASENGRAV